MLKRFFRDVLTSFVGTWIAIVLGGAVIVILVLSLIGKLALSTGTPAPEVTKGSVLVLDLNGVIEETETAQTIDMNTLLSGRMEKPQTLLTLISALSDASTDKRIEALYIKCGMVSCSPATLDALRDAVIEFKQSGKKIYAYGDVMGQGALYVASVADSVFVNPDGTVLINGLGASTMYMGSLFKKIGVDFQIAKVGSYKSAVEPFMYDTMSVAARAQLDTLFTNIWEDITEGIASSRKIEPKQINEYADRFPMSLDAEEAVKAGLISATCYERTMDDRFARYLNRDKKDINFVSTNTMAGELSFGGTGNKHIAVLYATGEIAENTEGGIDCYKLVPQIVELADDDDVVALVLRVDSPGGSVFGSQQIADALNYFKSKNKPFIVSMGGYAASGGYWISADADRIFANPMTVTGSIGIFGVIPNGQKLLNNIGLHPQTVTTNPNGFINIPYTPLNEQQMEQFNVAIRKGYDRFIARVAKGRKMPEDKVRLIAEGRVWDGATAQKLGLVDELGNLDKAVAWAADKTGVDATDVAYYPVVERSFWDMIGSMGDNMAYKAVEQALGLQGDVNPNPLLIWKLSAILTQHHIQARMAPVNITL